MPKYLVTGGAGFIGSHIVERLLREGESVRVVDNLSTGSLVNLAPLKDRIEFIQGDLCRPEVAEQATRGIETVFHQAALASVPRSVDAPLETHEACATATLNLLDACRRGGVRRLVYAASSSAYGNCAEMPISEKQAPSAMSPYAAAKLAGEFYVEAFAATYSLETVRLRYFNVFGPRQDPSGPYSAVIPLFVAALLAGRQPTIFGDGTQSRDFVYVENVAAANIRAANARGISGQVFNIASGYSLSVNDLLRRICEHLGKDFAPRYAPPRAGDVLHSWADIEAARRDLGFQIEVDLSEGLRRTIEYYATQQPG